MRLFFKYFISSLMDHVVDSKLQHSTRGLVPRAEALITALAQMSTVGRGHTVGLAYHIFHPKACFRRAQLNQ